MVRWDATARLSVLAGAELTYAEVGATRDRRLPAGYGHVFRDVPVGTGRAVFRRAADGLLGWDMHRAAGFAVTSTRERAIPGAAVVLRAGPTFAGLTIPCRVIYTVAQEHRQGFAYGTLPGHPEQGEEAFLVTIGEDHAVRFQVRAFSRPASRVARLGGRLTRAVQEYATNRYVAAVRRIGQHDATP